MDAPLLESLEGSGVFCFNWRARADSYGAIFIREGPERGSVGTALQTQPCILNIIQLRLSDQLFVFSTGKVDEIRAREGCTMSVIGFLLSLEPLVLAYICAHLLCYLFPSAEYLVCAPRTQAVPGYAAVKWVPRTARGCRQTRVLGTGLNGSRGLLVARCGVCCFCPWTGNRSVPLRGDAV